MCKIKCASLHFYNTDLGPYHDRTYSTNMQLLFHFTFVFVRILNRISIQVFCLALPFWSSASQSKIPLSILETLDL